MTNMIDDEQIGGFFSFLFLQRSTAFEVLTNFHGVFVECFGGLAVEQAVLVVDVVDVFALQVLAPTAERLARLDARFQLTRHGIKTFLKYTKSTATGESNGITLNA